MDAPSPSIDRRLLDKLIREVARAELQAIEHAPREARRLGEVPPVAALHMIARHASAMRPRFVAMANAHDLKLPRRGATRSTLRGILVDRIHDAERAFRTALLDLRHGADLVQLMRETARREQVFGVIRWCDDWLAERRVLIARGEAQLAWYADPAREPFEPPPLDAPVEDLAAPGESPSGRER